MTLRPFTTARLSVQSWQPVLDAPQARQALRSDLALILTDRVLAHLPPPLQLGPYGGDVEAWITAQAQGAGVHLVQWTATKGLIGLLFLATGDTTEPIRSLRIGYLLAEPVWGQGVASELVSGLVSALAKDGPALVLAGVGKDNPASARVLQKAGFAVDPNQSDAATDMFSRTLG